MESISYLYQPNNKEESKTIESLCNLQWTQMPNGNSVLQSTIVKPIENQCQNISKAIKDQKVFDNTQQFKVDKMIITEWGSGKIVSIDSNARICVVKIEGQEIPFLFDLLSPFLNIYCCILTKTTTEWASFKLNMGDTIESFKQKVGKLYFVHHSQIVMVHSGMKITGNSHCLSEIGLFEGDELLIIIKDPQEYTYYRYCDQKKTTQASKYNSITFSVNENILLTGINFYRNANCDVLYDLIISEITDDFQVNIIYELFNNTIKEFGDSELYTIKIVLPNILIKKGKKYEVQQNLHTISNNQFIGMKLYDNKDMNNGIKFTFTETDYSKLNRNRINSTTINQGMIPILHYMLPNGLG